MQVPQLQAAPVIVQLPPHVQFPVVVWPQDGVGASQTLLNVLVQESPQSFVPLVVKLLQSAGGALQLPQPPPPAPKAGSDIRLEKMSMPRMVPARQKNRRMFKTLALI